MPKSTLRRIIDEMPGASTTVLTSRGGSSSGFGSGVLRALDVAFTAYRGIVASNVQRAIEMLEDRKLNISGGIMTGPLYLVSDPVEDDEAASRHYVDTYMSGGRGASEIAVNTLANVPLIHVTQKDEFGRIGVPTAPGIDWTPEGVEIGGVTIGGPLRFTGLGRPVQEYKIEGVRTVLGASAPNSTTRAVGASGGVLMAVLEFSKTEQQDIYFVFHAPEGIDETFNCEFHLMWVPGASWSTGNYLWKIEYIIKAEYGGDVSAGTPTTISMDVTPTSAVQLIETHFTDTFNLAESEIVFAHLYRDVAGDSGNDVGDVFFVEVEYALKALGE